MPEKTVKRRLQDCDAALASAVLQILLGASLSVIAFAQLAPSGYG